MPTPKIYESWSGFLGGYAAVVSCILFLSVLVVAVILFTIPENWVGEPGSWRVGTFFTAMLISLCSSVLLQIHSFQRQPWVHRLPLIGWLFRKAAGSLTPWREAIAINVSFAGALFTLVLFVWLLGKPQP